jgi:acyl-CoA thioesterase I
VEELSLQTAAATTVQPDHVAVIVRRGTQLVAGMVVVLLAALATLLASGGATGVDAERCARLAIQSQARERLVTGHGPRVVVIGDSYSVGLGLRDPQTAWPGRLRGRVHVYGFSGSGFSARASECPAVQYAEREPHALIGGAHLVVIEGGLNDVDQPDADIRAGFRSLIHELSGRRVVVVGPPLAPLRADGARHVDRLLRAESRQAGVHYVSMVNRRFPYLDDDLHLTPAGHRAFGEVVARAIGG